MKARPARFALAVLGLVALAVAGLVARRWLEEERLLRALDSADASTRDRAAEELAKLGAAKAVPKLVRNCPEDASELRAQIAYGSAPLHPLRRAVIAIGGRAALPLAAMVRDPSEIAESRRAAAILLSAIGDRGRRELLRLGRDPDAQVRVYAILGLGYLARQSDARAIAGLIELLDDPQSELRHFAVRNLAHEYDEAVIAAIFAAASDRLAIEDDERVRRSLEKLMALTKPLIPREHARASAKTHARSRAQRFR